jgi:hypothetical protein
MVRSSILGGMAVASLVLSAPASAAQDQAAQQVRQYMDSAAKQFFNRGYHYGGFSQSGSLDEGQTVQLTIALGAGMRTQLMGGCDSDCSNLDLVLYDPAGKAVDQDVAADDYPIVSTVPAADGKYVLEVRMVKCKAAPCNYAIQQYVK